MKQITNLYGYVCKPIPISTAACTYTASLANCSMHVAYGAFLFHFGARILSFLCHILRRIMLWWNVRVIVEEIKKLPWTECKYYCVGKTESQPLDNFYEKLHLKLYRKCQFPKWVGYVGLVSLHLPMAHFIFPKRGFEKVL